MYNFIGYSQQGFLAIQKEVSQELIKIFAKNESISFPQIQLQRYPYPPWTEDFLLAALSTVTGLLLTASYLTPASYIIKALTNEKESQIKVSS